MSAWSAAEQAVLDKIDVEVIVALVSDLVALPTVSTHEDAGQHHVAGWLAGAGFEVDTWTIDIPALQTHPAFSAEFDRVDPIGVVGRMGQGAGPTLLLDGHIDVVPPGQDGDWTGSPFAVTRRDGRLVGRGTCDMKGGLAAAMVALSAITAAGVELAGTALLGSVIGEEDGGSGTLAMLQRLADAGIRPDACIIPEPTDLAIAPASAGALSWRIHVPGLSAHGCLREEGVSAIEKLWPVHRAVLELERRRNDRLSDPDGPFGWLDRPFAICGGRIAGGDWPSSEADWLTWEGRYGIAPGEDLDAARAELVDAVAQACAADPFLSGTPARVEWWGGQFLPGSTPLEDPVVTTLLDVVDAAEGTHLLRGMPYGCDLGLTVNVGGIPTVVYGPGDIRDAHRPEESVAVADLLTAARTLAVTAMRLCGVA